AVSTVSLAESMRASAFSAIQEEWPFEIIDGQRVELPPMSAYASLLTSRFIGRLDGYTRANGVGQAVVDMLFHLPLPADRNRRPDVAFVSYQRWARGRPLPARDNAWDVVPELAIEVLSPTDFAEDLLEKLDEYFRSGVQLVWVVSPLRRIVYVYESL